VPHLTSSGAPKVKEQVQSPVHALFMQLLKEFGEIKLRKPSNFGVPKTQTGVKMTQYKEKIRTVFNKRKVPVGGSLSRSFFSETIFLTEENDMKR
jgi:hypothetical protein